MFEIAKNSEKYLPAMLKIWKKCSIKHTALVSLFRKVPNYKILSFLLPKVNDKIIIIIIRHLAAEPAQVLRHSRVWWRAFNILYLANPLITLSTINFWEAKAKIYIIHSMTEGHEFQKTTQISFKNLQIKNLAQWSRDSFHGGKGVGGS
jgi:hypothetical protein